MKPRKVEWPDYLTVPAEHAEDVLWLGELSGWQLMAYPVDRDGAVTVLRHRCGHEVDLTDGEFLANAIVEAVYPHTDCRPYYDSAGTLARFTRPNPGAYALRETLVWEGDQA